MATITASMFMALDGVVEPAVGNWHFPYFNDEMGRAVDRTHDADVMLFGRVTYDSFAHTAAGTAGTTTVRTVAPVAMPPAASTGTVTADRTPSSASASGNRPRT